MPTEPRPRSAGTADEAAALAFVEAAAASDASAPGDPRTTDGVAPGELRTTDGAAPEPRTTDGAAPEPGTTDASTHDDLAAAREQRIRRLLDFEAGWASHGGAKARAIRAEFGWSTTRYYQVLDGLLATPEALRHDPMLVRRLLRVREGR